MAKFVTKGPLVDDAQDVIQHVMKRYHPGLSDCGTTVAVLMYYADEESDKPAMSDRGRKIRGKIDNTPLKYRKLGVADLQISIDADWWGMATRPQQEALVHHEISHRAPKVDDEGAVVRDDADRPTFERILHDFDIGVFTRVVQDYGEASSEMEIMREFDQHRSQQWLFADMAVEDDDEDDDDARTLAMDRAELAAGRRRAAVAR